jgi:predicted alpha/beta superfamily hydrolase
MIIKREVLFTPVGKQRTLHIDLPDGYEHTDERYPVMYFFDGHNLFDDADATYGKCWGLRDFLAQWDKPMIVVGIECSHEGNERLREYCPYHYTGGIFGDTHGIGDETVRWMVEELKPMIDREYRSYSFREATGIGGSSMGGLMSLYAGVRYNRVFSKAACLSSSIALGMQEIERDIRGAELDGDSRFYLSWGTREAGDLEGEDDMDSRMARNNLTVANLLREKGVLTKVYCQRGGHHCEADWEKQVPYFMEYLWK